MEIENRIKNKKIFILIGMLMSISAISILFIKDKQIRNILLYSYIYIILTVIMLFGCKFKIFTAVFLFSMTYTATIGISPICKCIIYKSYSDNQYALILIGYIMFLVGYFFKIRKLKQTSENKQEQDAPNDLILKILAISLFVISISASIIYVSKNFQYLFGGDLENGRIVALSANGILTQSIYLGTISIYILFEMVLNKKFSAKIFTMMFILIMLANGLMGFRSKLIIPIIVMIIMYNKKKKIKLKQIIPLLILLLIIGSVYGIMRGNSNANIITYMAKHFAVGSQNLEHILNQFPTNVEYQKGYTYIINILMLAPGPDPDFTLWLKEKLNMKFNGGGVTPTIIGEFYINFGIIGIIIGMLIMGIVIRKIDFLYKDSNDIFIPSYYISSALAINTGGIANIEINLLVTIIVYYTIRYISKNRKIANKVNDIVKRINI